MGGKRWKQWPWQGKLDSRYVGNPYSISGGLKWNSNRMREFGPCQLWRLFRDKSHIIGTKRLGSGLSSISAISESVSLCKKERFSHGIRAAWKSDMRTARNQQHPDSGSPTAVVITKAAKRPTITLPGAMPMA